MYFKSMVVDLLGAISFEIRQLSFTYVPNQLRIILIHLNPATDIPLTKRISSYVIVTYVHGGIEINWLIEFQIYFLDIIS